MKIQTATPVTPTLEAVRYTVENAEALERWCNGRLRGTLLPPEERSIQFDALDGHEYDCEVGDWIVKRPDGRFARFTDDEFHANFNLS